MSEKGSVMQIISEACAGLLSPEKIETLVGKLYIKLKGYSLVKEETALSTEFECDNVEYIKRFIAIKAVAGRTDRTLKRYKEETMKFFARINKPLKNITTDDIRLYLAQRDQIDHVSKVTQKNELLVLRSFFTTMVAEEILYKNPTSKIELIKTPKTIKEPFSEIEIEKMRSACKNELERCILEVLLSTGCRATEIASIDIKDIKGDTIKIMGKGNKERYVYLNAKAQLALEQYLDTRKDNMPGLFVTYWDKQTASLWNKKHDQKVKAGEPTGEHVQREFINDRMKKLGRRAGVENVHAHRFRRTAATMALRRGMPIEQVSLMLGHSQLSTTQIYARSTDEDVHNSHKMFLT